jgi:hypothetical protein
MLRRRPIGRTVARTAVVAGTATAVAGGVARHQANKAAAAAPAPEAAPAAPAPEPATAPDPTEQLAKLGQLRDQGILTEEEFSAQKAKILAQM